MEKSTESSTESTVEEHAVHIERLWGFVEMLIEWRAGYFSEDQPRTDQNSLELRELKERLECQHIMLERLYRKVLLEPSTEVQMEGLFSQTKRADTRTRGSKGDEQHELKGSSTHHGENFEEERVPSGGSEESANSEIDEETLAEPRDKRKLRKEPKRGENSEGGSRKPREKPKKATRKSRRRVSKSSSSEESVSNLSDDDEETPKRKKRRRKDDAKMRKIFAKVKSTDKIKRKKNETSETDTVSWSTPSYSDSGEHDGDNLEVAIESSDTLNSTSCSESLEEERGNLEVTTEDWTDTSAASSNEQSMEEDRMTNEDDDDDSRSTEPSNDDEPTDPVSETCPYDNSFYDSGPDENGFYPYDEEREGWTPDEEEEHQLGYIELGGEEDCPKVLLEQDTQSISKPRRKNNFTPDTEDTSAETEVKTTSQSRRKITETNDTKVSYPVNAVTSPTSKISNKSNFEFEESHKKKKLQKQVDKNNNVNEQQLTRRPKAPAGCLNCGHPGHGWKKCSKDLGNHFCRLCHSPGTSTEACPYPHGMSRARAEGRERIVKSLMRNQSQYSRYEREYQHQHHWRQQSPVERLKPRVPWRYPSLNSGGPRQPYQGSLWRGQQYDEYTDWYPWRSWRHPDFTTTNPIYVMYAR